MKGGSPLRRAPEGAALWTPAPLRRAPKGAALWTPAPLRRAPKGSALWTPAGAYAPGPEMLRISTSPAGGTGDLGAVHFLYMVLTGPPERLRAGRFFAVGL